MTHFKVQIEMYADMRVRVRDARAAPRTFHYKDSYEAILARRTTYKRASFLKLRLCEGIDYHLDDAGQGRPDASHPADRAWLTVSGLLALVSASVQWQAKALQDGAVQLPAAVQAILHKIGVGLGSGELLVGAGRGRHSDDRQWTATGQSRCVPSVTRTLPRVSTTMPQAMRRRQSVRRAPPGRRRALRIHPPHRRRRPLRPLSLVVKMVRTAPNLLSVRGK